jgi:DNA invertase Pin-like site-specific DNA recombinase
MAKEGKIDTLLVHSIDRLGRNTLDILQTIQEFTNLGVNVKSEKEGLETLIEGKENPIAKLMINIMATLSEFERERILERQAEGIQRAKERGVYKTNGGNKQPLSIEAFLNKEKNAKCLKELRRGESLRRAASLADVSLGTAQKVSRLAVAEGLM